MITIAIVEDEEAYAKQLTEYIEKYQQESGRRFRVIRFTDGDEIVEKTRFNIKVPEVSHSASGTVYVNGRVRQQQRKYGSLILRL